MFACSTYTFHTAKRIALSLTVAGFGIVAAHASPFAFGITDGGNIYQVDIAAKQSTLLYTETTTDFGQPNALAVDNAASVLYYRNASNGDLYSYNLNTGIRSANLLTGTAIGNSGSDAAFWGGSYWFVRDGSSTLVRVSNLATTPTVATFNLGAGSNTFNFGDIAISSAGTLYGYTSNNRFFSADISSLQNAASGTAANTNFSIRTGTNAASLQIALSPDESVMYGHNFAGTSPDNRWYTVDFFGDANTNTNFGNATAITGWNDTRAYRDIAGSVAAVVPEPSTAVPFAIAGFLGCVGTGAARIRRRAKK